MPADEATTTEHDVSTTSTTPATAEATRLVPRASAADTAGAVADVLLPLVARGVIARRPRVVGFLDRVDADRRAVRRMQGLRERYGPGPLLLRIPGRDVALVLSAPDVHRVLDGSPEPFATANREKRAALGRFQPHGVLISDADDRGDGGDRRAFNEAVLEPDRRVHEDAGVFVTALAEEADALAAEAGALGRLDWEPFVRAWWRAVRRVVLGNRARDDEELTDLLTRLRHDANWAYLKPRNDDRRERFARRLRDHLSRAEPGSLAAHVAAAPHTTETAAADQVPQWLFASDPAGMAAFRALALIAGHPEAAARARAEAGDAGTPPPHDLPFLRACVLESLRLWPTTPAILRDTTTETRWTTGTLPAGAAVLVFAPLFHRDDATLDVADRFAPHLWADDRSTTDWPLVPFSDGPAVCPGRSLVLLLTSTWLALLLRRLDVLVADGAITPSRPLPATLSPYHLRFAARPHPPASA